MDFKDVLAKIDAAIGPTTITLKSKAEAEAFVSDQLAKAKAEAEDEKDKEGADKAKKRLGALRKVLVAIEKASWEGQANSITIPVYEFGFESDLTAKTDKSETEEKTPPPGNQGTQADVGFQAGGGATGFGDAKSTGNGGGGGGVPAPGATAADGQTFAATGGAQGFGDAKSIGKAIDELEKSIGEKVTTKKNAEPFAWPNDLANPTFLKEGVTKRAEEWGLDSEKAK